MAFAMFYITTPSRAVARKIAAHLIKKRLVACANVLPIVDSIYRWKGKIVKTEEWALIVKTTAAAARRVEAEVRAVHPYEVPCVIKLSAGANTEFERWVTSEV